MADFRIRIIVDPTGAQRGNRQVRRELSRTERAARRTGDIINRAFAFGTVALGVRELVNLSDSFTNVSNRLRIVTDDTEELGFVTEQLRGIANSTRTDFDTTAEIYSRTAASVEALGISSSQTLDFIESLSQTIAVSGASASEARGALIQLSQGLGSGALRGEELLSLLEQLPFAADVIADRFRAVRTELRRLGEEGVITPQEILLAFAEARDEIEGRFLQTIPTISQAFVVLRNQAILLVGAINESQGIFSSFAETVLEFANNLTFDNLVLGLLEVQRTFLDIAISVASFVDNTIIGFRTVIAAVEELSPTATSFVSGTIDGIGNIVTEAARNANALIDIGLEGLGFLTAAARTAAGAVGEGVAAIAEVTGFRARLASRIAEIVEEERGSTAALFGLEERRAEVLEQQSEIIDGILGRKERERLSEEDAAAALRERISQSDALARRRAREFEAALEDLREENMLLRLNTQEREIQSEILDLQRELKRDLTSSEQDIVRELVTENTQLERQNDIIEDIRGAETDRVQRLQDINDLFDQGRITAAEFAREVESIRLEELADERGFFAGFERGFRNLRDEVTDFASQIENAFISAARGVEDVIVDTLITGQFSLQSLIASVEEDIARLATRAFVTEPLLNLFAGAAGIGGSSSAGNESGANQFSGLIGSAAGSFFGGFQNGGSFDVPGSGGSGRDRTRVSFDAEGGERVTVSRGGPSTSDQRPIVVSNNFNFPNADADSFRRSEGQVANRIGSTTRQAVRRNS